MFDLLGILLGAYTVYAVASGRVFAKAGAGGVTVERAERPAYFWTVVAVYAALSVALLTVF